MFGVWIYSEYLTALVVSTVIRYCRDDKFLEDFARNKYYPNCQGRNFSLRVPGQCLFEIKYASCKSRLNPDVTFK